ncbi:hypothetical protein Ga0074812_124110 [Parafrankia irregularis]|uniref:Uncharacterized protein n=1 Tax=Parafrankia irregularis TaxID=795642 RepID=A0A0S4QU84_9ACTN|nr:hypothetical protein Ga0074812_124110 [Parafrankia irregularis]
MCASREAPSSHSFLLAPAGPATKESVNLSFGVFGVFAYSVTGSPYLVLLLYALDRASQSPASRPPGASAPADGRKSRVG